MPSTNKSSNKKPTNKKKKLLIIVGASVVGLAIIIGTIVAILGQAKTEDFMCSNIGGEYVNDNIYESDLEQARFFKCPQATFDRLAEEKRLAEEQEAEDELEQDKRLEESTKKKTECEAQGKVYSSNWGCMTETEMAEREAKANEDKTNDTKPAPTDSSLIADCKSTASHAWDSEYVTHIGEGSGYTVLLTTPEKSDNTYQCNYDDSGVRTNAGWRF